jgi:3-polyprenyl-4-hydroxybenzoate decarboxylase
MMLSLQPILLARLAQLDNGGDIIIGNAANTTVKIAGNLQVTGTTETISATELKVDDLTIAVASGSATAANGQQFRSGG